MTETALPEVAIDRLGNRTFLLHAAEGQSGCRTLHNLGRKAARKNRSFLSAARKTYPAKGGLNTKLLL